VYIWVASAMVPLLAAAALAIDNGYVLVVHTQLQGATDAAAAYMLRERLLRPVNASPDPPESEGRRIANGSTVIGADGQLLPEDFKIRWGGYNFDTRQFRPHGLNSATAVSVTTHRALDLLIAPLVGTSAADVYARSVAAVGCREIVIAQDITASWRDATGNDRDFRDARAGLKRLVAALADRGRSGDRIGLVVFGAFARRLMPLRPLPGAQSALDAFIDAIEPCLDYTSAPPRPLHTMPAPTCGGTNHGLAIQIATRTFDFGPSTPGCGRERLIVILSDGRPCRQPGPVGGNEAFALLAADDAAKEGISIAPVMVPEMNLPPEDCPEDAVASADFNASLARGFGRARNAVGAPHLRQELPDIAAEFPVRLVR
jgi:hypothetical protein